jgi:sarcosine oxidase subunit beta
MAESADVVVIGGGVIGASTAFHLTKAGLTRVTILERGRIGSGATGKSHSLVRMHYTNPHDAGLAQRSLPYFHHWLDLVGSGDPRFVRTGVLRLVADTDESALRANVAMLRSIGVETSVVGPDDIRALDSGCAVADVGLAAWEPDSGYADPISTAEGFAAAAEERGAAIRLGVTATGITTSGDRLTGVTTTAGHIPAGAVVLAAGAWSNEILTLLGIDLGLITRRIQVVVFRRPAVERQPQTTILDGIVNVVIRPDGDAATLVAIGFDPDPVDPDTYDESVSPAFIADARRRLVLRRPAMRDAPMRGGWSGAVAMSPDGHIILDRAPSLDGLFLAVGCGGTNFKTAPAIGLGLAEWITNGQPRTVNLRPFRATRFAEGQPIVGAHEYGAQNATDIWR